MAASLAGPIFTFGGIEGQVQSAEAQERQAVFVYQRTILNALRETNDALTGSQKKIEELAMQVERVASCASSRACPASSSTRACRATSTC